MPDQAGELGYTNVIDQGFRFWQVSGANASAVRETVLTAQKLEDGPADGFSVASGTVELPPAEHESVYKISSITIPAAVKLADTAKDKEGNWIKSDESIDGDTEKNKIKADPLNSFLRRIQAACSPEALWKNLINMRSISFRCEKRSPIRFTRPGAAAT